VSVLEFRDGKSEYLAGLPIMLIREVITVVVTAGTALLFSYLILQA